MWRIHRDIWSAGATRQRFTELRPGCGKRSGKGQETTRVVTRLLYDSQLAVGRRSTALHSRMTTEAIRQFADAIALTKELWDYATLRLVAIRVKSDWVCIASGIVLHLRGTPASRKLRPLSSDRTLALEKRIDASDLPAILEAIASGCATLSGHAIRFASYVRPITTNTAATGDFALDPPSNWQCGVRGQFALPASTPPMVNGHFLSFQGSTQARALLALVDGGESAVNEELRSPQRNINGIHHLIRRFGASLYAWHPDSSISFACFAPVGIALNLDRVQFVNGVLRLSIVAASKTAARLAHVGVSGDREDGGVVDVRWRRPLTHWDASGPVFTHEEEVSVGSADHLMLILRTKSSTVQQVEVPHVERTPNLLQAAQTHHHPESDARWRQFLLDSQLRQSEEFAEAVARLFVGLGCSAVHLPRDRNSNSSDTLVRFGRDHLLLIESTTAAFDTKKVGNLLNRAVHLRQRLRASGLTVSDVFVPFGSRRLTAYSLRPAQRQQACVVPIMVSSFPAAAIPPTALRDAFSSHIAVLTNEDLRGLLSISDEERDYDTVLSDVISGRLQSPLV